MNAADLLKNVTKKLTAARNSVTEEIARLRAEIVAVNAKLQHVQSAPLPLDEMDARARAAVKEAGDEWLTQYGSSLINGDRSLGTYGHRGSVYLPDHGQALMTWGGLCASDPVPAAAMLSALVRRIPFEPGPPSAERPALIVKLQKELAELGAAEERMIDDSIEAGVVIAHRPAVIERRANEARRQALEEAAVENRQAREAELNRQYAERRSRRLSGQSEYIYSQQPRG